MARLNVRKSLLTDSDGEEEEEREPTPISTASNDRKRIRQSLAGEADQNGQSTHNGVVSNSKPRNTNPVPKQKRAHQPGAIVRVKLINFVTYTDAEFKPGPNLNMVIGPNGTGKSTLVCAICLGLGWGPQLLGRAKDPAEFVKHGCKEAIIEIELQRWTSGPKKTSRNPIITRTIKKDSNKSTFMVNGQAATNKAVLALARDDFNIQVDNLCQFLPQDRVVEFAQMNPVQMLESTLQAAAEPSTIDLHEKLKVLRQQQQELMHNNKGDREGLANLQKRQEAQRTEVEKLRERQDIQQQIERLGKCRPIPKYAEAKKASSETRQLKASLTTEVEKLKRESRPALTRVNAKQKYHIEAKKNKENHVKEVKRAEQECLRLEREIQRLQETQQDCVNRIEAEKKNSSTSRAEIARLRQVVTQLKVQKEQVPEPFDARACNNKIQEYTVSVRELKQKLEDLEAQSRDVRTQGKTATERRKQALTSIEALETQSGQQEAKLESISRDTYQAWKWIKDNQSAFKMPVFGPPAVECRIKDPAMAQAVEGLLQRNDMKIITAQCKEDFRVLQRVLTIDKKLHDISLRTCSFDDLTSFRPPMSDEDLHRLGLEQWAVDCLEGPPTVLAMLCQAVNLHQNAISSHDVSEEQHAAIAASQIRGYIAGGKSIKFTRRAEYGAAGASATVRALRQAGVWTNQPVDSGRRVELQREVDIAAHDMHEQKQALDRLKDEFKTTQEEVIEQERAAKDLREEKNRRQQEQMAWNGLDVKIQTAEDKIENLESIVLGVRQRCEEIVKETDLNMFKKADVVLKYCENVGRLKDLNKALLEAEVIVIEAESDAELLAAQNELLLSTLRAKEAELMKAHEENDKATRLARQYISEVKVIMQEAEKLRDEHDDPSLLALMEEMGQNKDITERDLDDLLEVEQAKLELHADGIDASNTIREYEERAKRIARLELKLTDFREKQSTFVSSIKEVRSHFEAGITPIIERIDAAFAESFARIGCAGQVSIYKASSEDPADCTEEMGGEENGLDFEHWAIHIHVKFRENEPLALLDSHRQSGGERAVSTIFYLMALQSLSRSPFRVVDEINQGMDPRNERMVHGRMVDIAAPKDGQDSGSQYFLITPKLLSGLRYERGMTVLCIVSGEYMPSPSDVKRKDDEGNVSIEKGRKIDLGALAKRARDLRLSHDTSIAVGA